MQTFNYDYFPQLSEAAEFAKLRALRGFVPYVP